MGTLTVASYIKGFPPKVRTRLAAMRAAVRSAAPAAEETISYRMPAYKLNGILVLFAGFINHIGFYPLPASIRAFKKGLARYKTAKGSIQFPHDRPLPLALVKRMVRARVKENASKKK